MLREIINSILMFLGGLTAKEAVFYFKWIDRAEPITSRWNRFWVCLGMWALMASHGFLTNDWCKLTDEEKEKLDLLWYAALRITWDVF